MGAGTESLPLLPKILGIILIVVIALYLFPILIPLLAGLILVAVALLKNKPCDPNHATWHPFRREGIPKLEAVVKWAIENDMKMLFDVKDSDPELVDIIANLFEKYDLYDKAIVCSFYPWVVYLIKQGNQKILSGLTWRRKFFSYKDIENTLPRYTGLYHYLYVLIDIIHVFLLRIVTPWFLGADLLLTNNLDISKSFVLEQKGRGLHVAVWTVNDVAEMHWMLEELSVPILTDHPSYVSKISHLRLIRGQDYNEPALQNAANRVSTADFTK